MRTCKTCKETKSLDEFHRSGYTGYQSECKDCNRIRRREAYRRDSGKYLKERRNSKYRLSKVWYNDKLAEQDFACAICLVTEDSFDRDLAVDHNHKTGELRGLLCASCNRGLGYFQDNIAILKLAVEYLKQYEGE